MNSSHLAYKPRTDARAGIAVIYMLGALLLAMALLALAIDVGRLHMVKSQLQATADAAARAAAWRIPDQDLTSSASTSGYSVATAVAKENTADLDGKAVDTSKGDVVFGYWSQKYKTSSSR